MKNFLIKLRYGVFNKKILLFLKKIIKKRKNVFLSKIFFNIKFLLNITLKKNLFLENNYFNNKIIFIFGGDGSFINGIKNFFNKKNYIKCINFGNLGFLANNLLNKNFLLPNYIGNIIIYNEKINGSLIFLNEILIKNNKSLIIKIKKKIFLSDFIIISTSIGSSGHFFSVKNIFFKLNNLSLSLVCSHTNNKFVFFFKHLKMIIKKYVILLVDGVQFFYLRNTKMFINIFKNKIFLNNLKFKIYDK